MQRKTDFRLAFFDTGLSIKYKQQLQSFINETADSYTGDYLPPDIWFPGCDTRLGKLRSQYMKKINENA